MKSIIYILVLLIPLSLFAAEVAPAIPEGFEPEVRIIDTQPNLIEEYRSKGRVYMIKITPKKGRPYYLVDADGDGNMESHRNEAAPRMLIPSWVLFSW